MSSSDATRRGLRGVRPGRSALTGARRRRRGEQPMVPDAEFTSYYGKPVLNPPVWKPTAIAGYFFLGGLAGGSSLLAAGAEATGLSRLARAGKLGAVGAITLSLAALIEDLGRPGRFLNMLRVFKPTSPMSLGSWLLAGYGPLTAAAATADLTGRLPRLGQAATAAAAALAPAVATYTAVLASDTAVPAWHEAYPEMPFTFAGSGLSAAGGLGLLAAPIADSEPARRLSTLGAGMELAAIRRMEHRLGDVADPYKSGISGKTMKTAEALTVAGVAIAQFGRRSRIASAVAGGTLLTASALTRLGIFQAGMASAQDPKYTINPQRARAGD